MERRAAWLLAFLGNGRNETPCTDHPGRYRSTDCPARTDLLNQRRPGNYFLTAKNRRIAPGIELLSAQFPEANENPIYIVAQASNNSSMLTPSNLSKLDSLSKWIASQAHVTSVLSLTHLPAIPGTPTLSEQQLSMFYSSGAYSQNPALAQYVSSTTNGNTTLITVKTDAKIDSSEGKALLDTLRAGDQKAGRGLTVLVGGLQATSLDFNRYLYGNFPKAIQFILLATYILLLFMFHVAAAESHPDECLISERMLRHTGIRFPVG